MIALFAILRVVWPYILGAILLGAVWYGANHWCNGVCRDARGETSKLRAAWDADRAERIKRTTEITNELSSRYMAASADADQLRRKVDNGFAPVSVRVQSIPRGPAVVLPAAVAGVLNDAAIAGNSARASADAGTETRADPLPQAAAPVAYDQRELAEFFRDGPLAYADAYQLWKQTRVREDACLDALNKGQSP